MLDLISLYPIGDTRGSRRFLNLNNGAVITRSKFLPLPTPISVRDRMNHLADKEGLFINKKLHDWKYSHEVSTEFDADYIEVPTSETERDAIKQVSNDVDYEFDIPTSDREEGTNLNNDGDDINDYYPKQPTLEHQSTELLQQFDPSQINSKGV
jgi:hypothetical protein